jgi:tRNA (guanine37-N1)-methyltransferase
MLFCPSSLNERIRIARLVQDGEIVFNMFAGVGCFSIIIARHSDSGKIYSIDINPEAFRLMKENVRINGPYTRIIKLTGGGRIVAEHLEEIEKTLEAKKARR